MGFQTTLILPDWSNNRARTRQMTRWFVTMKNETHVEEGLASAAAALLKGEESDTSTIAYVNECSSLRS